MYLPSTLVGTSLIKASHSRSGHSGVLSPVSASAFHTPPVHAVRLAISASQASCAARYSFQIEVPGRKIIIPDIQLDSLLSRERHRQLFYCINLGGVVWINAKMALKHDRLPLGGAVTPGTGNSSRVIPPPPADGLAVLLREDQGQRRRSRRCCRTGTCPRPRTGAAVRGTRCCLR
ncbi:hypothetical protein VTK56DRAFT_3652 [Thermocarpiscus australiensis]